IDSLGTYTYSVGGNSICGPSSSTVTVISNPIADAGSDGSIDVCNNGVAVDLFNSLGGAPTPGGIWSPALASGAGIFDPAIDAPGSYTYELSGDSFCGTDTSTVNVTITEAPNVSGLTVTVDSICLGEPSLVSLSGGSQLANGQY